MKATDVARIRNARFTQSMELKDGNPDYSDVVGDHREPCMDSIFQIF